MDLPFDFLIDLIIHIYVSIVTEMKCRVQTLSLADKFSLVSKYVFSKKIICYCFLLPSNKDQIYWLLLDKSIIVFYFAVVN